MSKDEHKLPLSKRKESIIFMMILFAFQVFMVVLFSVWVRYSKNEVNYSTLTPEQLQELEATGGVVQEEVTNIYGYFRDINIMIFFGFGFLMTFLRRYGYSALGYTFIISALVAQWSVLIYGFFETVDHKNDHGGDYASTFEMSQTVLLQGLFCAGAVMISYGAVLGRVTPLQMLVVGIFEPIFYFLNMFIGEMNLEAIDVGGGMYIHLFGSVFGLTIAWFLTDKKSKDCEDNSPSYTGDYFAMAGTLFLWMMWPSFNAAIAPLGEPQFRAIANTFLSLTASTIATFIVTRLFGHLGHKIDMVHVQNSSLAGGVVQGCLAHMNINPGGAIGMGFLAGVISVIGYLFISPFLQRRFNIQDTCGIHNLHFMPGFIGSIAACIAAWKGLNDRSLYNPIEFNQIFRAGEDQARNNAAATFISIGIAIAGGLFVGMILKALKKVGGLKAKQYYQDSAFWHVPIDYPKDVEYVVEQNNLPMPTTDNGDNVVGGGVEMKKHNNNNNKKENGYRRDLIRLLETLVRNEQSTDSSYSDSDSSDEEEKERRIRKLAKKSYRRSKKSHSEHQPQHQPEESTFNNNNNNNNNNATAETTDNGGSSTNSPTSKV
ncbi:Rh-like protein/ammonium transporter [Dictyostelium discoideum AX4]|uniref:Rhesus-like glycoprotein B n=1 Tax=Dictyostelium discoideum TaxID=44689 RepID=RHGB_DICDI|nr:Rh-like protein/ammonium transporter [Dictyostelium discoideum AX4]Q8I0L6.1 RecName: Full=Rhesus-like glycoprotein B; AltName: Full=Rh50-like protein rhgB [Dictyostelium discoideum]AAN76727.1 RhgB [Dictyostelium discoideum]AAN76728.1 RhgB [Dictyostelium discoideum]EAL67256.1 Rh-like protein/ammonium transporter [Dictyostelium discoideum AX4]|eukprot:XP_641341.1 Rh-like protein/ammonium transporter [Dictyostelium discoideum AX4]